MAVEPRPWHSLSVDEVAADLAVVPARGLSTEVAAERLARCGENRLIETKPRLLVLKFLDQFKNLLVLVLLLAAASRVGDR